MNHWVFILCVLLPPWAGFCLGICLSFFNPTLALFVGRLTPLPCRPIASAMLSFDLCLLSLFWARRTLSFYSVPINHYYRWACSHALWGFLGPFHSFEASMAHFIPLDILCPLHSLGHPRPIPILHSHGFLLSLLGFPDSNYHIIYFRDLLAFPPTLFTSFFLWAPPAHFCLLSIIIMPMGLLLLSLGSLGLTCFLWGPFTILQAHGPYFYHSGLMVFFSLY